MLDKIIAFENTFTGGVVMFLIFVVSTFIVPFVVAEIRDHVKMPLVFFIFHPVFVFVYSVLLGFIKEGNGWTEAIIGGFAFSFLILFINVAIAGHIIPTEYKEP